MLLWRGNVKTQTVSYVLSTAKFWNGPIGHFHLVLDKQKPNSVLSLCWDGELTKTGLTTYEFTASNFRPTQDVRLLVVE